MNLTLRELEYFVAIADHRHFGAASQKLKVSQPTLSMQFKKLEQRLGGRLVERLPRDVILTARGAELLPIAREILRLAADIEDKEHCARFRLGVIPTLSPYLLPKINRGLSVGARGQRISLIEAQTSELIRMVKTGTLDVAILSTPLGESGIKEVEIFCEPFFLAVCKSHRLADRTAVRVSDLENESLLLLGEGHCLRNQALSICDLNHAGQETDLTATSIETLRSMVGLGSGVTLIPKLAVRQGDGLAYVPFAESTASRNIGIIFRPSFSEEALINKLIGVISNVADRENLALLKPIVDRGNKHRSRSAKRVAHRGTIRGNLS